LPAMVLQGFGRSTGMRRNYENFSKEGYAKNAVIYSCVSKIARSVASVDLQVCRKTADGVEILPDHPIVSLLNRPNPNSGGADFMEALVSFRLIAGNAYILRNPDTDGKLNRPPSELWLLSPERVSVLAGAKGLPSAYEYNAGHGKKIRYSVSAVTGKSDVLHLSTFNPLDGWYGMSPMDAAAYSTDTMNSGLKWNRELLDNSAKPSGGFKVVSKEGEAAELSEEQFARMREMIDNNFSGAENAGRPLLLEGGLEWQEMGISPKDMDYAESLLMSARFIASVYGVPPQLINIPGESTYSNYEQAKEAFWIDTVLPMLDNTLDEINHWLPQQFGADDVYIKYDIESVQALENKRASKYQRIEQSAIMTVNEKREALGFRLI